MNCDDARRLVHEALDAGGRTPADVLRHLEGCPACRELAADLDQLTSLLRARPRVPLPPDALDAVWHRTIDERRAVWVTPWAFRRLAAAVFAVAVLGSALYLALRPAPSSGPTAAEIAAASAQADLVFGYTARALSATRVAAADRVLASRVSPAVRGSAHQHPRRLP